MLLHSWQTHIDRTLIRNVAVKLLLDMPVGVFGFLALRQYFRTAFAVTVMVLIGLMMSSRIEMTKLFDDGREYDAVDVVRNVSGTVFGVALGYLYQNWLKGFVARADRAKLLDPSGAILLFCTWASYQTFHLFLVLSLTRLAEKFGDVFAEASISPVRPFLYLVEWLVIAQLLQSLLGAERTRRLSFSCC